LNFEHYKISNLEYNYFRISIFFSELENT